jgi:hypothetical protein
MTDVRSTTEAAKGCACMRIPEIALGVSALLLAGCSQQVNPSFPLTSDDAKVAWSAMADNPKPLARPILVLGGIYDPGLAAAQVEHSLREIVGEADHGRIVHVGFLDTLSFDGAVAKAIEALDKALPSNDPAQTTEVDVIGFSMGGLVARYAASDMYAARYGRRLHIHRLYTVSSPHRGAKLAWVPMPDSRVSDMRSGSDFLQRLNSEAPPYEIVAYARLGDEVVGEHNAAPPGQTPHWLSKQVFSHASAYSDKRILADIARRLRDEEPFAREPASPLPE